MPSWPVALGGMFAAGYAATQAQKVGIDSPSLIVGQVLKGLGGDGSSYPGTPVRVGGTGELSVLQGEVDRLHKLLADVVRGQKGGAGYTVIHTGRGGWSVYIMPAALAGGAFYLYVRYRGLSLSDFFVVTNSSMQKFRELVSGSFTQLWEELRKHKDEFLSRLSAVGQQQQQLIEKQNAMDDRLKQVGDDVGDIRETTNNIDARVGQMDHTMQLMASGVARANEGIYLLCAAVADVTRRVGMDNSKLRSYVQAAPPPPELADSSPGLRQLLEGSENVTVQGSTVITQLEDSPSGSVSGSGGVGANGVLSSSSSMPPALRVELDDCGVMYSRREVAGPPSMNGRGIMSSVGSMWSNSKPRGLSS